MLDGEVTFSNGEERIAAGPGDTVWAPRGVPHAFRIDSPLVRMLLLITPGGGERLPDFDALGRRMGELGIGIAGPPLA